MKRNVNWGAVAYFFTFLVVSALVSLLDSAFSQVPITARSDLVLLSLIQFAGGFALSVVLKKYIPKHPMLVFIIAILGVAVLSVLAMSALQIQDVVRIFRPSVIVPLVGVWSGQSFTDIWEASRSTHDGSEQSNG